MSVLEGSTLKDAPLLEVSNLKVHFPAKGKVFLPPSATESLKAVDGVSFTVKRGETVGLVGESGSGKSTIARAITGLAPVTEGVIRFQGRNLAGLREKELRPHRRKLQLVFQDPYESLSPRMTIGQIIAEPLAAHRLCAGKKERRNRVAELLEMVRLDPSAMDRYPHEFSGGQRQRIGIARALAPRPDLIVCDEPVSALDVSIQGQIVNLLRSIQKEQNLALLFIAHDLAVVEHVSDRILVLYLGRIVESNHAKDLIRDPLHPYTKALLASVPRIDPNHPALPRMLSGEIPSPLKRPSGCHFHTRCPIVRPECRIQEPELRSVSNGAKVACDWV